ncbi:MAG: hypothetical protein HOM69_16770 [Gammaproteobacteria bacterium]|nr:hypothetical protein [Gammaproteobacteria bacterium]
MNSYLTKTSTLVALFVISGALVACFMVFTPVAGGVLLDSLGTVAASQQLLGEMSDAQKAVHFRITLGLDMIFPLAYGGFFVGLTLKHFNRGRFWLAMPALLVIPTDIFENLIQLLALTGAEDLLGIKALLTPIKFTLFNVAAGIAAVSLCLGIWRHIRS